MNWKRSLTRLAKSHDHHAALSSPLHRNVVTWSDCAVSANSNYSSVLVILARSAQASGLRDSHAFFVLLVSCGFHPVVCMSQGRAADRPGVEEEPGVIAVCQLQLELGVF
ncbi:unnamed protein product [Pipistrellus nathusii]|uniref:Uncharacterized protein n=1 Tax=Pipistrellus nathusii TaxID=59473 RepID=A0ABN9ZVP6_PIPNA